MAILLIKAMEGLNVKMRNDKFGVETYRGTNKTRYNKMMDTQHVSYVVLQSKKRVKCKKNNYM